MWNPVATTTRETLHVRYRMLPYLYTLMHRAHTMGNTVVRPMMFE
jgi:alpha-glucosidase (family GH31 glycosyl hydrolase)